MELKPFIIPAMGSHGGATAEGQVKLLKDLGITESSVGAPIGNLSKNEDYENFPKVAMDETDVSPVRLSTSPASLGNLRISGIHYLNSEVM
jgi:hypothetical protein